MNRFGEKAKTAFRCFAVSDYEIRILFKALSVQTVPHFCAAFQVVKFLDSLFRL